jgi:hypothetical protein
MVCWPVTGDETYGCVKRGRQQPGEIRVASLNTAFFYDFVANRILFRRSGSAQMTAKDSPERVLCLVCGHCRAFNN